MITPDQTPAPSAAEIFEGIIDAELLAGNMEVKMKIKDVRELRILLRVLTRYEMNEWQTEVGSYKNGVLFDSVHFPHDNVSIKFSK